MKKSLIALAVAGVVSAPAFAATSNVDIYGKINLSVDIVDRDTPGVEDEFKLADGSSRVGFKGSEDLGGGLSAIWQVESAVAFDGDGASTWGTRNTFVGLSSKTLGTVKLGRNDTSYKNATGKYDVFDDTLADYNTVMGSDSYTNGTDFNEREPNSLIYTSPALAGFTLSATYAQRNESGTGNSPAAAFPNDDPQLYSFSVNYANGPLSLAGAYEAINDDVNGGMLTDGTAWKLGGGYKFGNTQLAAVYERLQFEATAGPFDYERDAFYLSAAHQMGAITLKAAYAMADEGDVNGGGATDDGADFWALGVDYALSKRTKLFFIYTALDNDRFGDYVLGDGGTNGSVDAGAGGDPSGVSIGVSHSF